MKTTTANCREKVGEKKKEERESVESVEREVEQRRAEQIELKSPQSATNKAQGTPLGTSNCTCHTINGWINCSRIPCRGSSSGSGEKGVPVE